MSGNSSSSEESEEKIFAEIKNILKDDVKVNRPLDSGFELLPGDLKLTDFISIDPIPVIKPKKYTNSNKPMHPIFGDSAVLSKKVLKIDKFPQSEHYAEIVSEMIEEGLITKPCNSVNPEDIKYLSWDQVERPMTSSTLSPAQQRRTKKKTKHRKGKIRKNSLDEGFTAQINLEGIEELNRVIKMFEYGSDEDK